MFKEILKKLGSILSQREIPYMIIGGQAVLLYGEPRLTKDIDVTIGLGTDGLAEILKACKELGLTSLVPDIPGFVRETMVLPMLDKQYSIRIDFIFSSSGYERMAIQNAKNVLLDGTEVRFASIEDVIIHKIFAHRPKDLEDIRNIMFKNASIDFDYVERWLAEFDQSIPEMGLVDLFKKLKM